MYSYGIYVFHVPILVLLGTYVYNPLMQRNGVGAWIVAYVAGATLITFLVSALSYELFERKILRYKRFFEPRVAPQPPVALATPESLALDGE
jgi:peptidoglycan/LPS O-acetylase OafA/YrhL